MREVALAFLRLGCISFGGPIAHLGYFRSDLVQRRRWLDDAEYADLVALAQFLPGPASSQVVFALGMRRAGLLGAIAASLCFTLPSAFAMIAFAYGLSSLRDVAHAGWLHGLRLTAVAIVAQAVWGMGKRLCPDRTRASLAVAAAVVMLVAPGSLAQIAVLVTGAAFGWWRYRHESVGDENRARIDAQTSRRGAIASLALFVVLLVVLPLAVHFTHRRSLAIVDGFYRAGALVFGGGHVVLPLLRAQIVPRGWLGDDRFLAGYGAAQAIPGPLFTFAAYLGTSMSPGPHRWLAGILALFAIFLPAWLLIGGALPFWNRWRANRGARAALAGANAAVVGVLLAALWNPVIHESVSTPYDVAAALCAFALLEFWKSPPWIVVVAMAALGFVLPTP